nr:hypothetical protein GCM10020092_007670 [Actinoplanes digitatis]
MPGAPVLERDEDREQPLALRGQQVVVAGRVLRVRDPPQHAVLDKRRQPFGERPAAHAQRALQRLEPGHPAGDVADHQEGPPVGEHAEGLLDAAVGINELDPSHALHYSPFQNETDWNGGRGP